MDCEARKPKPSCEPVKTCPPITKKKIKTCPPPCPPKPSTWRKIVNSCGPKRDCWYAVGFVLFPHVGGLRSAIVIKENLPWYEGLDKPAWGPPGNLIAPVWTVLYTTMGYASFLVWRDGGGFCYGRAKVPLILYGTQLALNWAWPFVFFKSHNIGGALATATALWFFAASTAYTFCPINQCAGYLMIPYLLWVTWAAAINFGIWQMTN